MKLRKIHLGAFRHFLGQHLDLDRDVTVLVGRSDTGKTSLLVRFLDQHFYNGVTHGSDRPQLPGCDDPPQIRFSLTWEANEDDRTVLENVFNRSGRVVTVQFGAALPPGERWRYSLDDIVFFGHVTHAALFPKPRYGNVGAPIGPSDRRLLPGRGPTVGQEESHAPVHCSSQGC